MLPTQQASNQLKPVFDKAQGTLQSQIPAIQDLYSALLQGLQAQSGNQVQNVVNSAVARGVNRPMLTSDTQDQLAQTLAQQTGQLGVQQAQDTAATQAGIGQLNIERAKNIFDLAKSLQESNQQEKKAKLDRLQTEQQAQLDLQKANQDFNVQQAAYQTRKAAAAQKQDNLTTSQALLQVGQLWKPGKDGYVNPKQWNELRKAFMQAGFSGSSFDAEFSNLINPEHQKATRKDLMRYQGVKINTRG